MYDAQGNWILGEAIFAAMGQAFFTLSLGIGAIAIFGSYIGKGAPLDRGGSADRRTGYLRSFCSRANHLPGLLRLWSPHRRGALSGFCYPAQYF